MEKHTRLLNDCGPGSNPGTPAILLGLTDERIDELTEVEVRDTVKELYAAKARDGLLDAKFTLTAHGRYEASSTEVLRELLHMQLAIDQGRTSPIDFGDLRWKD